MVLGLIAGSFLFFGLFCINGALRMPPIRWSRPPRVPPAQLKRGASSPLRVGSERKTYALTIGGTLFGLAFVGVGGALLWLIHLYW